MKLRICVLAPLLAAAGCSDGDDVTFQPPPVQVTPACKQQCLASTGFNICIQGRAYVGAMLANKGPTSAATIKDATVNIFDLMSLYVDPSRTPLSSVAVAPDGCFIANKVRVPFTGVLGIQVADTPSSPANQWDRMVYVTRGVQGSNLDDLAIPAWTVDEVALWETTAGANLDTDALLLVRFADASTLNGVAGIAVRERAPSTGVFQVFYFNFASDGKLVLDLKETETTTSGIVLILQKNTCDAVTCGVVAEKGATTIWKTQGALLPRSHEWITVKVQPN